jgi:hypothetical protein
MLLCSTFLNFFFYKNNENILQRTDLKQFEGCINKDTKISLSNISIQFLLQQRDLKNKNKVR